MGKVSVNRHRQAEVDVPVRIWRCLRPALELKKYEVDNKSRNGEWRSEFVSAAGSLLQLEPLLEPSAFHRTYHRTVEPYFWDGSCRTTVRRSRNCAQACITDYRALAPCTRNKGLFAQSWRLGAELEAVSEARCDVHPSLQKLSTVSSRAHALSDCCSGLHWTFSRSCSMCYII